MGRKTSDKEKVFLKQCQMFMKENIQNLKAKMNPTKNFDFSEKNLMVVKKLFAEVDDPQ